MRRPLSRALATALGFALAATVAGAPALAATPGCPDAAQIEGDEALVTATRLLLERRGIATEPIPGCPRVIAVLTPREDGTEVTLIDRAGRVATRSGSDAEMVATLVESWARSDIDEDLLSHGEPDLPPPAPVVAGAAARPAAMTWPTATAARRARPTDDADPGWLVGASATVLAGSDGTTWFGGALRALAPAGPLRIGALTRVAFEPAPSSAPDGNDEDRLAIDVLLVGEVPIDLGGVTLRPGIGVGLGWAPRRAPPEQASNTGFTPGGGHDGDDDDDDGGVGEGFEREHGAGGASSPDGDSGGLRVEAQLGLDIPLGSDVSAALEVVFGVSPFASTTLDRSGRVDIGEPLWSLGGAFGFRFGGL